MGPPHFHCSLEHKYAYVFFFLESPGVTAVKTRLLKRGNRKQGLKSTILAVIFLAIVHSILSYHVPIENWPKWKHISLFLATYCLLALLQSNADTL